MYSSCIQLYNSTAYDRHQALEEDDIMGHKGMQSKVQQNRIWKKTP